MLLKYGRERGGRGEAQGERKTKAEQPPVPAPGPDAAAAPAQYLIIVDAQIIAEAGKTWPVHQAMPRLGRQLFECLMIGRWL